MEQPQVCESEDAIRTLLEQLVDPKLPAKSDPEFKPSQSDEEVMAKQVQAVVLLYNYYHRSQHPKLQFMNLESFCKLAVILKPTILSYMKLTRGSNDTQLVSNEKQLSLTEKAILDACNIAMSLDASKADPIVNESAVSKVAVLLVDSEKQNALLQFGILTEGVWSVFEKEVQVCNLSGENSTDSMPSNKRKRVLKGPAKREGGTSEDVLKKTATFAVCEATGIAQDDLALLESHIVYSTSKENTATRFYILQYTSGSKTVLNAVRQVPIKDLMKSLQGPLFSRSSFHWTTTPVVEYFHLLPFARILADWSNSASNNSKNSELTKRNDGSRPLMVKDENVSPDTQVHPEKAKKNDSDESSMIGLPNLSDGSHDMELDALPTTESQNEEMCTNIGNGNGIKSADQKIGSSEPKSSLIRISDKVKAMNTRTPRITESKHGNVVTNDENSKQLSVNPDPVTEIHRPVTTFGWNNEDIAKMLSVIASNDKELSEAALKVLLKKRDKLSFQQRDMEDQIALYDKKIQTILDGNKDIAAKITSFLEICEDTAFLRSVSRGNQSNGSKRLLAVNGDDIHRLSSCEELDNVCWENSWILPTYRVMPVNGGFVASVVVKGDKSEEWTSTGGEVCADPSMARELAARQILEKLCNRTTAVITAQ